MVHEEIIRDGESVEPLFLGPEHLTPGERLLAGSTEPENDREALLRADHLRQSIELTNIVRARSQVADTGQPGQFVLPAQVVTLGINDDESTRKMVKGGMVVHAQLPPLDRQGRVSGEWELVLLTRKGEKRVVTDQAMYAEHLAPQNLAPALRSHFSVIPPREGRPFPRLVVRSPNRRALG